MAKRKSERLVGWLVSYGLDDLGASYEIRSGRSFVTGKNSQLGRAYEIEDSSISNPHIAVSADAKHTVLVQDVFSENGSYLTRAGSEEEVVISGPTEIAHGDWLRVGDTNRFQVCLIDGSSK